AVDEARIMHRDISSGNILTLPRTIVLPTGKKLFERCGVLADRELSKPLGTKGSLSGKRQPVRTGTWQYMSVGVLNKRTKAIETSDELESFLHVLLCNADRYLHSNCADVGSYVEDFFDSY
ncbi:hypothetical protein BD413DRAFT_443796, partial [Trametes elegans]